MKKYQEVSVRPVSASDQISASGQLRGGREGRRGGWRETCRGPGVGQKQGEVWSVSTGGDGLMSDGGVRRERREEGERGQEAGEGSEDQREELREVTREESEAEDNILF